MEYVDCCIIMMHPFTSERVIYLEDMRDALEVRTHAHHPWSTETIENECEWIRFMGVPPAIAWAHFRHFCISSNICAWNSTSNSVSFRQFPRRETCIPHIYCCFDFLIRTGNAAWASRSLPSPHYHRITWKKTKSRRIGGSARTKMSVFFSSSLNYVSVLSNRAHFNSGIVGSSGDFNIIVTEWGKKYSIFWLHFFFLFFQISIRLIRLISGTIADASKPKAKEDDGEEKKKKKM